MSTSLLTRNSTISVWGVNEKHMFWTSHGKIPRNEKIKKTQWNFPKMRVSLTSFHKDSSVPVSSRLISWQYFCHHLKFWQERGTNMLYLCQIEHVLQQRGLPSEVSQSVWSMKNAQCAIRREKLLPWNFSWCLLTSPLTYLGVCSDWRLMYAVTCKTIIIPN